MATYTEKDKVVPIIVEYGARGIKSYTEEEHLESIKQAFIDKKADFITLDSNINGQQFLSANVAWAMNKGWLYCSSSAGYPEDQDAQETIWAFRLTEKGIKELTDTEPQVVAS